MYQNMQQYQKVMDLTNLIWGGATIVPFVYFTIFPLTFRVSVPLVLFRWTSAIVTVHVFARTTFGSSLRLK